MSPGPRDEMRDYVGRELLDGKRALITGGDSGIGRAVAVAFAKEGADVAIAYLTEHEDANHTRKLVESAGRRCVLLPGDLGDRDHCAAVVEQAVTELGGLDVVVNNVAHQESVRSLDELTDEQWEHTFAVNIHSYYRVTKAALPYLREGGAIVNTSSVNGLRGNGTLIDYAATKGAVNAFTYSMARNLVDRGIRVNAVAPGPVWTPLIPATLPEERVAEFGEQVPMGRAADPDEIAPSYVFFAAERLSSYYTGEILAPVGGETLPG
ncbi:SDR family oxidoreductase [Nonomuraea sp. NPDC000554]|uniref:SDR family oxidoreductase n=1 Tax=Nonomuraea sp. NPDC000554 TaxID=3154259 RepID=UPI003317D14D